MGVFSLCATLGASAYWHKDSRYIIVKQLQRLWGGHTHTQRDTGSEALNVFLTVVPLRVTKIC